jgi:4-amino-4-deoxy-L-arabinose transferase-like glycosyltransferase
VRFDRTALIILCAIVGILFLVLPKSGDIWYMDASRNALNGAFVLDFVRAMPFRHPMEFAIDYYRQWPALTILFYPPLFYAALAASYAAFGVSEAAALVPELAALVLLGWGAYRLSRNWLDGASSLAVALLIIGAPETYFWGQQVMLDIPAYAALVWAAVFHVRFLRGATPRDLYLAVLFVVAAIWTKYNAAFFIAVMAASLLVVRGWRFALDPTALKAAALGAVLLLPLAVIFVNFATYDLTQAESIERAAAPRWSVAGLSYYVRAMPGVLSWLTTGLAVAYCFAFPFVPRLRLVKPEAAFLLIWVALGYCFYAMIAVKEPRHILFITYPIVLAAVLLLDRGLAGIPGRAAAALGAAAAVCAMTIATRPPPYVSGMRQAAETIARLAPPESDVAFWGRFDGTFIYDLRAYTGRTDLQVVRLDKLLLSHVVVALGRGFTENDYSPEQIAERLRDLHVQYVVAQTGYGEEIGVIRRLETALHSDRFREVERVKMAANYRFGNVSELVIYRAAEDVPRGRVAPSIDVPLINRKF